MFPTRKWEEIVPVESPSPPTPDQIAEEMRDVALLVHNAEERKEERDVVLSAHEAVARLAGRYQQMYAALSEIERMKVERALGRRLQDIKRLASLLPRAPQMDQASTPDRREGGGAVEERRITGVSWQVNRERQAPAAELGVGADVESWCGKCGEATRHHVVAMIGAEPRQVVCTTCNSRHTHRTGPARARRAIDGTGTGQSRARTAEDVEIERKAEMMRALGRELAEADNVRVFDPKQRYKAGEIISHPDFGRGKIENVLRASLLVRFGTGLKSVMLT